MSPNPGRTAVYRVRGEGGDLLYIGMTNDVAVRWNSHQAVQPWWGELRSLTVEWYETRDEATAAEKAAILSELPKYNVTYLRNYRREQERRKPSVTVGTPDPAPESDAIPRPESQPKKYLIRGRELVTPEELASFAGLPVKTLARLRAKGGGPAFHQMNKQMVLYSAADVHEWLMENCSEPTNRSAA